MVVCFINNVIMDPNSIFVWNVCGLNSLVETTHADIVCLQETKTVVISQRTIIAALGLGFSDFELEEESWLHGETIFNPWVIAEWTVTASQFSFK
jgi:hypothetical protein